MNIPLKQYWTLLVDYLKPQWAKMLLLALLLFSEIGLQLLSPQIMRTFIDTAIGGGATRSLVNLALSFIGVGLAHQVLTVMTAYTGRLIAWRATDAMRANLVDHCLRLDMTFHNRYTPGALIERLDGDVTMLSNFFSLFTVRLLGSVLLLFGILAVVFREDWRLGLAFTGFAAAALIVLNGVRGKASPVWKAARQASADLFGFIEDRLSGLEDIRTSGGTHGIMRHFHQILRDEFYKRRQATLTSHGFILLVEAWLTIGNIIIFAFSIYLFTQNLMTVGTIYLVVTYINTLLKPLYGIMHQLDDLQRAEASIGRINELVQTQSLIRDGQARHALGLSGGPLAVEFRDLSFHYAPGKPVLRDISYTLGPGQTLGLVGRTGSGKTTLSRLLFRLYDPTAGQVYLNDQDIQAIKLNDLRRRVGLVTQEVQLFQATVRDNLTFFDLSLGDDQILSILDDLGLRAWYDRLPEGLDTWLGGGGQGLSAGEAQLLAFARVFLRNPGLVILDEASSRLDPATEYLLEKALDKLLADRQRTSIIIAHRLSTLDRVDNILLLEGGRILEQGSRAQLALDPNTHFYQLRRTGLETILV